MDKVHSCCLQSCGIAPDYDKEVAEYTANPNEIRKIVSLDKFDPTPQMHRYVRQRGGGAAVWSFVCTSAPVAESSQWIQHSSPARRECSNRKSGAWTSVAFINSSSTPFRPHLWTAGGPYTGSVTIV